MVYEAVEHVVFDHTRTVVLSESIMKHVDKYFEAGKAAEALARGGSTAMHSLP